MNKFTKESFKKDGQYLLYGPERKFVARFKHGGPFTMMKFRKELMMMHTPKEYFAKLRSGMAPVDILKQANKGWYDRTMATFKLAA